MHVITNKRGFCGRRDSWVAVLYCYRPTGYADEADTPRHIAEIFLPSKVKKKKISQVVFQVLHRPNLNAAAALQCTERAALKLTLSVFPASLLIFQLNCLLARAKECIRHHKSGA